MCFSNNLKQCRLYRQMTQREVAKLIGVAPSTYSQYESGAREPDVEKIKSLSKILNVSADCLLFGNNTPPEAKGKNTLYDKLNDIGKTKADEYIKDLTYNPQYTSSDKQAEFDIAKDMCKEIENAFKKGSINLK